jgi:hypothetical protein
MHLEDNTADAINSVNVATYWFAILVYIFFSWLFYWFVHRLKLKAWVIAQIFAIMIAAGATGSLLFISKEHQKQLEDKAMLEEQKAKDLKSETDQVEEKVPNNQPETLDLSEGEELPEIKSGSE